MKTFIKLSILIAFFLIFKTSAYAKTIHLSCENIVTKKQDTILSLTEGLGIAFEHRYNGDMGYKLKVSDEYYNFSNEDENRYWNINRYTGYTTLKWTSSDGLERIVNFNCDIAKKKKF